MTTLQQLTSREAFWPVAAYTCAWALAYLVARHLAFRSLSADFSNRVISTVHALVAMAMSAAAVSPRHPFSNIGKETSTAERAVLSMSVGYFIYDTVTCMLIDLDWANMLHHGCTVAGMAVGLVHGRSGAELVLCLLLMEVSNPFLHARFLLKELGRGCTQAAAVNDMLFACTFFVCRILVGPFLTCYTLASPSSTRLVKAGAAGIQIVSFFWFQRIVQILLYKVRQAKGRGAKSKGG